MLQTRFNGQFFYDTRLDLTHAGLCGTFQQLHLESSSLQKNLRGTFICFLSQNPCCALYVEACPEPVEDLPWILPFSSTWKLGGTLYWYAIDAIALTFQTPPEPSRTQLVLAFWPAPADPEPIQADRPLRGKWNEDRQWRIDNSSRVVNIFDIEH